MSKEKDLQKAINEIKDSLQEKDLDTLKNQLLSKINSGNINIADLLQDDSLQETLQSMLKNKNVTNLLQNPEIINQLSSLLNTNNSQDLIQQIQRMMGTGEKKN